MAHCWRKTGEKWTAEPVDGALPILLERAGGAWVVWEGRATHPRVNGVRVELGLRVVEDRDEIRAGPETLYFSTEERAAVTAYPGGERALFCPRCKQQVMAGSPAVRCPNPRCGGWHHQSEELPCWTYARTCALCSQATRLDGGFAWQPEEE